MKQKVLRSELIKIFNKDKIPTEDIYGVYVVFTDDRRLSIGHSKTMANNLAYKVKKNKAITKIRIWDIEPLVDKHTFLTLNDTEQETILNNCKNFIAKELNLNSNCSNVCKEQLIKKKDLHHWFYNPNNTSSVLVEHELITHVTPRL